ncbi:hypothetical protein Tco_0445853 [Tanacetum coccineum]
MAPPPAANLAHLWLRYEVKGYTPGIVHSYEQRLETIWSRPVNLVHVLDFEGLTPKMRQDLAGRLRMVYSREGQQEMAEAGFGAYWAGNDRLIPDKGDLRDYWMEISSGSDFLGLAFSYVLIRDPVRRLCHRMIAYSISGRGQAPENVVTRELPLIDLHKLGRLNICTRYDDTWAWVAPEILVPAPAQASPPPPPALQPCTMSQRIERLEEEVHDLRRDVVGLRGDVESFTTEQSRVSTWLISCMTQLMDASGHTY